MIEQVDYKFQLKHKWSIHIYDLNDDSRGVSAVILKLIQEKKGIHLDDVINVHTMNPMFIQSVVQIMNRYKVIRPLWTKIPFMPKSIRVQMTRSECIQRIRDILSSFLETISESESIDSERMRFQRDMSIQIEIDC